MEKNTFQKLSEVDVNDKKKKKGRFDYLSWAFAVAELRKACPSATWEVLRFDGLPYLKTETGYFVEVAVTVDNITLSQLHPILDARNNPITKPNSFNVNTSIQRCLVKAIALHGLGLYIYAGEDLPDIEPAQYSDDDFNRNLNAWKQLIADGKATAEIIVSKLTEKNIYLSDEQLTKLESKDAKNT